MESTKHSTTAPRSKRGSSAEKGIRRTPGYGMPMTYADTGEVTAKPCPFCRSAQVRTVARSRSYLVGYVTECVDCGAGQSKQHRSAASSLDAWNERQGDQMVPPVGYVLVPVDLAEAMIQDVVGHHPETKVALTRLELADAGPYVSGALKSKQEERAGWLKAVWARLVVLSRGDARRLSPA